MTGPNPISARLRQAVIEGGYAHPDGRPNKRGFARAMCEADGNDWKESALRWEQNVYRWLDEENPGGMSDEYAELAARVLNKPQDYFKPASALQELQQQRQETDAVIERLLSAVERIEARLRAVEDAVLGQSDTR